MNNPHQTAESLIPPEAIARRQAEAMARANVASLPKNFAALSPEETWQALHDLRVYQLEMDAQNEELRRTQADLAAAQARYFDLYNLAPVGYCTLSEQGWFLEANLTAAALLGVAQDALVNQLITRFILPADHDLYGRHRAVLFETGAPQACDLRMIKPDGTMFWAHLDATVAPGADGAHGCRLVMHDITALKRAGEALRIKNLVFDESLAANSIADLGGIITEVNEAFLQTWGYSSKAEVVGQNVAQFFNDPAVAVAIVAALNQTGYWEGNYIAKKKDGSTFVANGLATVLQEEDGTMIGCQSSVMDITDRRRAEVELQSMQKLQSLGTLAGGIAHDFNNMMTGVVGNISLAKDTLTQNHPGYPLLKEAEKSMNRAIGLTKQLLTFAKGGEPIKEDLNLGTLVEEVARFNLSGSQVTLAYRQDHDLWSVKADKGQLGQVVANLTINARQAMPEGGRLSVMLENVELADEVICGLHQGKYIKVTLQDVGGGIDPKHLDQIFDPYFTTKQAGNGLGLAAVYSIINKHGGHIGVASTLGQGTTFTFYLPASGVPPSAVIKPPAMTGPPQDRHAHILVMDDEEMIRGIVVNMLNHYGFSVATAADGQEAIQMYQQAMTAGMPFDVVIMDLTIPGGMGGKQAVQGLLEIDPHVRAIVSSGYADSPVMSHYADYGFKGAVAKPYTQRELQDAVIQVLN
jgi:PAS domain S-box-containing protein